MIKTGDKKKLWGVINYKGETIVKPAFDDFDDEYIAPDDYLLAKSKGKWGWIDISTGEWAIEPIMDKKRAKDRVIINKLESFDSEKKALKHEAKPSENLNKIEEAIELLKELSPEQIEEAISAIKKIKG